MRVFLGIPIISKQLTQLQDSLKSDGYSVNPKAHLTLKFFGSILEKKVEEIHTKLLKLRVSSFYIRLDGINTFPNNRRVLWVGASSDALIRLHEQIDAALQDIFHEDAGFTPHLTLARSKRGFPAVAVKNYQTKFTPEQHLVNEYHLYESVPGDLHHTYTVLHTYILQ